MKNALIIFISSLFFNNPCLAKKIIFLGDSLTEGYGIPQSKAFPQLIENELKKHNPELKIINSGSSGSTSASAVSRLNFLLKSKPSVVVIALGGNDGLRGVKLNATENNLQKAITLVQKNKIKVILAGVRIPTNYGNEYRKNFESLFVRLSKKNKIIFIPQLLKGVAGNKSLNLPDGIHPNQKGHAIIAQTVLPYIKKVL